MASFATTIIEDAGSSVHIIETDQGVHAALYRGGNHTGTTRDCKSELEARLWADRVLTRGERAWPSPH